MKNLIDKDKDPFTRNMVLGSSRVITEGPKL